MGSCSFGVVEYIPVSPLSNPMIDYLSSVGTLKIIMSSNQSGFSSLYNLESVLVGIVEMFVWCILDWAYSVLEHFALLQEGIFGWSTNWACLLCFALLCFAWSVWILTRVCYVAIDESPLCSFIFSYSVINASCS